MENSKVMVVRHVYLSITKSSVRKAGFTCLLVDTRYPTAEFFTSVITQSCCDENKHRILQILKTDLTSLSTRAGTYRKKF